MKLAGWQRVLMKRKAKKEMVKIYNNHVVFLEDIKDKVGNLMDLVEEKHQLHLLVILCAELISGFEKKKDQEFLCTAITETVKNFE